uniref:NOD1/2 winged helix domain-containing protein n=1 Tax=Neogobius melanostomus TaxID=47308 RepID=A0A8C6WI95_9GOBI
MTLENPESEEQSTRSSSESVEEQSSREAVLNITVDFLRRMEQEQLAERLRNSKICVYSLKNIKYHGRTGADLHWTPDTWKMVKSLGKLAFEQLQKGNLIFYESDLREYGLKAAEVARYSGVFTQVFREEQGLYQDKVYCFIHLTVQDTSKKLYLQTCFALC